MSKEENDVITLKSELEMQYNVAKICKAYNDLYNNISLSKLYNTNLKLELKGEKRNK